MSHLTLCYYGELDPFTGMADEGPASLGALGALVADLQRLCLLYDAVIVPPENLLAHPLALPAFEMLAPLVHAGRLGTSGSSSSPGLHAFVAETADLYREARVGRSRGRVPEPPGPRTLGARRMRALDDLVARWRALLPERWPFLRDVPGQIAGFTDRLRRFCETAPLAEASRRKTLQFIDATRTPGSPASSGRTSWPTSPPCAGRRRRATSPGSR